MTFKGHLVARRHRIKARKNEEKRKRERAAASHAGHPVKK